MDEEILLSLDEVKALARRFQAKVVVVGFLCDNEHEQGTDFHITTWGAMEPLADLAAQLGRKLGEIAPRLIYDYDQRATPGTIPGPDDSSSSADLEFFLDTLVAKVIKGGMLLDKIRLGWWDEIDLTRLQMTSNEDDILGQLWGDTTTGFLALTQSLDSKTLYSTSQFGFGLTDAEQDEFGPERSLYWFKVLGGLWKITIRVRRSTQRAISL